MEHTGQRSPSKAQTENNVGKRHVLSSRLTIRGPVIRLDYAHLLLRRAHRRSEPPSDRGRSGGRRGWLAGYKDQAEIVGGWTPRRVVRHCQRSDVKNTDNRAEHAATPEYSCTREENRQRTAKRPAWSDPMAGKARLPAGIEEGLEGKTLITRGGQRLDAQTSTPLRLPAGSHGQAKDQGLWVADAQNAETARPTAG